VATISPLGACLCASSQTALLYKQIQYLLKKLLTSRGVDPVTPLPLNTALAVSANRKITLFKNFFKFNIKIVRAEYYKQKYHSVHNEKLLRAGNIQRRIVFGRLCLFF